MDENRQRKYTMIKPENTGRNQAGQFCKGKSGNPTGKPKGARNKATLAALELLEGEAKNLSRKALEMALAGDTTALRLCLERIVPPTKERPLQDFELPVVSDAKSALDALNTIAQCLAGGELLPGEAATLCNLLEQYRKHFETTELQQRIEALEEKSRRC
ncbi:MAG: DUF5681 domain-containing protein [Proteobacteria bacterium]|nr:DUF5681 domain-containing protein [Pseudomonadota bacterium]